MIKSVNPFLMKCLCCSWKIFLWHSILASLEGEAMLCACPTGHGAATANTNRHKLGRHSHELRLNPLVPSVLIPPAHSLPPQVVCPPPDYKTMKYYLRLGLCRSFLRKGPSFGIHLGSAWAAITRVVAFSLRGEKGTSCVNPGREGKASFSKTPWGTASSLTKLASQTD